VSGCSQKKNFLGIKSLPSNQTEERNLMDNRQAKFILNAYRPGGQDANDPRFAEALEQVRRDPILQRWFDESVAFDAAMTQKLSATPVPRDLRDNILTGVKVTRAPHPPQDGFAVANWKNRWRKWAIAAAVVLSATLGVLIWHHNTRPAPVAGWQLQALDAILSSIARNESHFDVLSRNPADLVNWLRANYAPAGEKLPDSLDKLPSIGCKTFFWHGKPVSLICFTLPEGRAIHLVMTNVSEPSDRRIKQEAKVIRQGQWATATWREGNMIYMLALEGSRDELRSYML
jgi:hypothetical protein